MPILLAALTATLWAGAPVATPAPAPPDTLGRRPPLPSPTLAGPLGSREIAETIRALLPHPAEPDSITELTFTPDVRHALVRLYRTSEHEGVEQVRCLRGAVVDGTVVRVTGLTAPRVVRAEPKSVTFNFLDCAALDDLVGVVHTHPTLDGRPVCYQSRADWRSFALRRYAMVDVVLCEPDRIGWLERTGRPSFAMADLTEPERLLRPRLVAAKAAGRPSLPSPRLARP